MKSRIENVDILRGFALLGMLVAHFQYYWNAGSDKKLYSIVSSLVDGKFFPLFACLFGISYALQFERWSDRPDFVWLCVRRLLALAAIAVVTAFSEGVIVLQLYALWGFALLFVGRWSFRALLILALVVTFARPSVEIATFAWDTRALPHEQSNAVVRHQRDESMAAWKDLATARKADDLIMQQGPFLKRMAVNLRKANNMTLSPGWIMRPEVNVLPIFLLGMCAVRLKLLEDPMRTRRIWWAVFISSLCLVAVGEWLNYVLPPRPSFEADPLAWQLYGLERGFLFAVSSLGESLWQGLAYATAMILLITKLPRVRRIVGILALPGRLALTNFIMHAAFLELFFAKFWLHLPLTVTGALAGSLLLFGFQVLFSRWWLDRFRYGPFEWVWRSLTYARWMPIRIGPPETRLANA